jgi:hypothetical protein
MKFEIQIWKIQNLLEFLESDKIILKPPYQRNFIWTPSEQKDLIESIKNNYPLPSLFLYQHRPGDFEMVDGQQRTRTILRFYNGIIKDKNNTNYSLATHANFLHFNLCITVITDLDQGDSLEVFYARVNKTGKRLNDAELNKAEYYNTNFLKLVDELTESQEFKNLSLFRDVTIARMNDRDFVEEIVTLMYLKVFSDKKLSRDRIYKNDISEEDANSLKIDFFEVLKKISELNSILPLNKTRFRQKNDFYTFFALIFFHPEIDHDSLIIIYKIMQIVGKEISPSNENSEVLREYAIHCVSQSNSKNAREIRYQILNDILLNSNPEPTNAQNDVINYYSIEYNLKELALIRIGPYYSLDIQQLSALENNLQ